MKYLHYIFLSLFLCSIVSCSDDDKEEGLEIPPLKFLYSTPENSTDNVLLDAEVAAVYNTTLILTENHGITVNGEKAVASVVDRKLIVDINLEKNTRYEVSIPATALTNIAGESASVVSFSFTTVSDSKKYEAEDALLSNGAVIEKNLSGFSGTGYVNQKDGDILFKVIVPEEGKYLLNIRYSNGNQKKENDLVVNGVKLSTLTFDPTDEWKVVSLNKISLSKGSNTIEIKKNWGWTYYDYIEILPQVEDAPFNIAPSLVTENASAQTVKLYDFLKENFGQKVISGAMANYSTGLEEANWIYAKTGKWPALAGFDFIDYTRDRGYVNYEALVNNAKEWWTNNGIVTLMWHWRDPSRITDEFYTDKTSFDATKISDTSSDEYKAIIADIDIIAGYLKQLHQADIPVLWRPLHEASGGWFWWGAKGAEPCKTIWKLMYERLVDHHSLNNLIWVWTSDSADDAVAWYPGDEYVDIIGMDIYPGENQHGSQYIAFDKVKALFEGRKIIALTECGSIPEINEMFEYGDTWSWFMPWNGEYTRSDNHNGASFLNAVMQNDNVITRDQMPNLK